MGYDNYKQASTQKKIKLSWTSVVDRILEFWELTAIAQSTKCNIDDKH